MASENVLQEYLVRLGYATDLNSFRRFEASLNTAGKRLLKIGTSVTAMVAATGAATTAFAYNMRKMYFASDLTKTSVKNLQSMSFATKQVGVDSQAMQGVLKHVANEIRYNPGAKGFIEGLGVKTEGRETLDVVNDLIPKLKQMDPYIGKQLAENFLGMDADTFTLLTEGDKWDKYLGSLKEADAIHKKMGVNVDENRKRNEELTHAVDKLDLMFDDLGAVVLKNPLVQGIVTDSVKALEQSMLDLVKFSNTHTTKESIFNWIIGDDWKEFKKETGDIFDYLKTIFGIDAKTISTETENIANQVSNKTKAIYDKAKGSVKEEITDIENTASSALTTAGSAVGGLLKKIGSYIVPEAVAEGAKAGEEKYGVPAKITAAQWALESGGGKKETGAFNYFGIKANKEQIAKGMYKEVPTHEVIGGKRVATTAKFASYGSAAEAMEAHAKLLATGKAYGKARGAKTEGEYAEALQGTYATDPAYAAKLKGIMSKAQYAAGGPTIFPTASQVKPAARIKERDTTQGKLMKQYGVKIIPYKAPQMEGINNAKLAGNESKNMNVNQTTNINVTGTDAVAIGKTVVKEQSRVNGDLLRNAKGSVR